MTDSADIVIVGAGIHGAGVAQAAAARGYSVLVLEQAAIAAGTSSRSSKLIHGGLRYLETGQFHLVRESLHERTVLLRIAPELVQLRRFYVPVYRHTRRRPWQLRVGLLLYALLAGFRRGARFGTVPRREWPTLGGLELRDLQQVFWYQDAQTDDAALTRAVMASARALGARLLVPARFSAAELRGDDVLVRYAYPNDAGVEHSHECHARVLINAAGPWADAVADCITPAILVPKIERVQGSHILLPLAPPSPHAIYYVESPRDGRAIFVMPWHAQTLVGTTEARFHGDPAQVTPSSAEIHYLLGVLKHYFPRYRHCSAADLSDSFAGVRVLPSGAGHAFHRSRETLLLTDRAERPRVLSIYGGKLTGWRAVSKRVLQAAARSLPRARRQLRTDEIALGRESQR